MNYVTDAINFVQSFKADQLFEDNFEEFDKGMDDRARRLPTRATSNFKAFKIEADDIVSPYDGETVTRTYAKRQRKECPIAFSDLAHGAWMSIGGLTKPDRSLKLIAAARELYTKYAFHHSILQFIRIDETAKEYKIRTTSLLKAVRFRDWSNADAVAGSPELLSNPPSPFVSAQGFIGLFASLAFSWIDEAAATDDNLRAISLLAIAANMLHADSQFLEKLKANDGISAANEIMARREFARRGLDARHAPGRMKKERGIEMYRTGNFSSKDKAAEVISKELKVAYSTVRKKWLQGLT